MEGGGGGRDYRYKILIDRSLESKALVGGVEPLLNHSRNAMVGVCVPLCQRRYMEQKIARGPKNNYSSSTTRVNTSKHHASCHHTAEVKAQARLKSTAGGTAVALSYTRYRFPDSTISRAAAAASGTRGAQSYTFLSGLQL